MDDDDRDRLILDDEDVGDDEDFFTIHMSNDPMDPIYWSTMDDEEGPFFGFSSEGSASQEEEDVRTFNLDLPPEHRYLGSNMETVSGRVIHTDGSYVSLPMMPRSYGTLIPGQTIPLTVRDHSRSHLIRTCREKDNTFGCIASKPSLQYNAKYNPSGRKEDIIGTTAEIFEYVEDMGTLTLKAKGRQRFRIINAKKNDYSYFVAQVQILPEVILPHPLQDVQHQSLCRIRSRQRDRVRRRDALLTQWPMWVYDSYDPDKLVERVNNELVFLKQGLREIDEKVPKDPTGLSFWMASHLDTDERLFTLRLNSPVQRLRWLLRLMKKSQSYSCHNCDRPIGSHSDVFAMSIEGAQSTFVNPHGFLHETITLKKAKNLTIISSPSTQYSWFPGYAWCIAVCDSCHTHIGWQFKATNTKLQPPMFWGLTRHSLSTEIVFMGQEDLEKPVV